MNRREGRYRTMLGAGLLMAGLGLAGSVYGGYWKGREEYRRVRDQFVFQETEGSGLPDDSGGKSNPVFDHKVDQSGLEEHEDDYDGSVSMGKVSGWQDIQSEKMEGLLAGEGAGLAEGEPFIPGDAPQCPAVDWEGLLAVNDDITAWLELSAADISYPVVKGVDNDYYLHRSVNREERFAGSIFMDTGCQTEEVPAEGYNTVIYGHNMRDGSMFAGLHRLTEEDALREAPYFWLCTPKKKALYQIFSVHTARAADETYQISFSDSQAYTDWLRDMREMSDPKAETGFVWDTLPSRQEMPDTVTLSTCTSDASKRLAVQGIRVWLG